MPGNRKWRVSSQDAPRNGDAPLRARGGRVGPDLSPATDVLVVSSLPGLGRLAECGREVILRGKLYRDRLRLLEFVTDAGLRIALAASPGGEA